MGEEAQATLVREASLPEEEVVAAETTTGCRGIWSVQKEPFNFRSWGLLKSKALPGENSKINSPRKSAGMFGMRWFRCGSLISNSPLWGKWPVKGCTRSVMSG